MKKVDHSIKIGMVTYGWGRDQIKNKLREMLDIAGGHIDFLSDRGPSEDNLETKLSIMKEYNANNGTQIKYCNTEWLPYDMFYFNVDAFNCVKGDINKSYMFSK